MQVFLAIEHKFEVVKGLEASADVLALTEKCQSIWELISNGLAIAQSFVCAAVIPALFLIVTHAQ